MRKRKEEEERRARMEAQVGERLLLSQDLDLKEARRNPDPRSASASAFLRQLTEGTLSLSVLCRLAERAAGAGAQGPQSQGQRRGRRRRVRRPGVGLEVRRGLRQGPVQDEAQPQAHQQPEHRLQQRAAGH